MDKWRPFHESPLTTQGTIDLVAGEKYDIQVEYQDTLFAGNIDLYWGSDAQAWEIIPSTQLYLSDPDDLIIPVLPGVYGEGDGLQVEYFDNVDRQGEPVLTRTEGQVNFDWGLGSPDPSVPIDGFSARWSGQLEVPHNRRLLLAVTIGGALYRAD